MKLCEKSGDNVSSFQNLAGFLLVSKLDPKWYTVGMGQGTAGLSRRM